VINHEQQKVVFTDPIEAAFALAPVYQQRKWTWVNPVKWSDIVNTLVRLRNGLVSNPDNCSTQTGRLAIIRLDNGEIWFGLDGDVYDSFEEAKQVFDPEDLPYLDRMSKAGKR
jgi:hypothetical protein